MIAPTSIQANPATRGIRHHPHKGKSMAILHCQAKPLITFDLLFQQLLKDFYFILFYFKLGYDMRYTNSAEFGPFAGNLRAPLLPFPYLCFQRGAEKSSGEKNVFTLQDTELKPDRVKVL